MYLRFCGPPLYNSMKVVYFYFFCFSHGGAWRQLEERSGCNHLTFSFCLQCKETSGIYTIKCHTWHRTPYLKVTNTQENITQKRAKRSAQICSRDMICLSDCTHNNRHMSTLMWTFISLILRTKQNFFFIIIFFVTDCQPFLMSDATRLLHTQIFGKNGWFQQTIHFPFLSLPKIGGIKGFKTLKFTCIA